MANRKADPLTKLLEPMLSKRSRNPGKTRGVSVTLTPSMVELIHTHAVSFGSHIEDERDARTWDKIAELLREAKS